MAPKTTITNSIWKEVVFQIVLHIVLFLFFSFDRNQPQIQEFKVVAFINYALGALVINYVLLPHFFYKKNTYCSFCTLR